MERSTSSTVSRKAFLIYVIVREGVSHQPCCICFKTGSACNCPMTPLSSMTMVLRFFCLSLCVCLSILSKSFTSTRRSIQHLPKVFAQSPTWHRKMGVCECRGYFYKNPGVETLIDINIIVLRYVGTESKGTVNNTLYHDSYRCQMSYFMTRVRKWVQSLCFLPHCQDHHGFMSFSLVCRLCSQSEMLPVAYVPS